MLFEAPLKIYWRIVIVLLWWTSAASQRHPFLGEIWVKVELLSLNLPSLQIFLSEPLSNITFLVCQTATSTNGNVEMARLRTFENRYGLC